MVFHGIPPDFKRNIVGVCDSLRISQWVYCDSHTKHGSWTVLQGGTDGEMLRVSGIEGVDADG